MAIELKSFIRRGKVDENHSYKNLIQYSENPPQNVIMLLEGRARRRLSISKKRTLFENYYPTSFIGLEDILSGQSFPGAAGVFPLSHYVVWPAQDFLQALEAHPELARRAIYALSRRVRIYDERHKQASVELKVDNLVELGDPEKEVTDALYQISFSDDDEFPPNIIDQLSVTFQKGESMMQTGDKTNELFILLEGSASVYHETDSGLEKIDEIHEHDMVGEMAQFDGLPRSATVYADTRVIALAFKPENFHLLFRLHSKWSKRILQTLADRIASRRRDLVTLDLKLIN